MRVQYHEMQVYCDECLEYHEHWHQYGSDWVCGLCGFEAGLHPRFKGGMFLGGCYAALWLPYPPSANRYWRVYRNRVTVSKEASNYKRSAGWIAREAGIEPMQGLVKVMLDVYRPRKSGDLDNRVKCLLDALNGIAYIDDKQVVEIHARRFDVPSKKGVEVYIEAVNS